MVWGLLIFAGAWWLSTKSSYKTYNSYEEFISDEIDEMESDKDYK